MIIQRSRSLPMPKKKPNATSVLVRLVVALPIVGLHYGSFIMPVFLFDGHMPVHGFEILLLGWLGVCGGAVSWYANPFFLAGLVLFVAGEFRVSRWLALAGLVIALPSFLVREWYFNEANATPIKSFAFGFYAWLSSLALLAASTFIFRWVQVARQ